MFFIPESKPNLPEVALPLSTSLTHAKQRESLPTPETSPHGHGGHGGHGGLAHAHGAANGAHGHGGQHGHSGAHGHGAHGSHGQYGLALGGAGFLSPPALFNIKSEPSAAAGYDSYPPTHATPPQHYHSHQHYLHALQVNHLFTYFTWIFYSINLPIQYPKMRHMWPCHLIKLL